MPDRGPGLMLAAVVMAGGDRHTALTGQKDETLAGRERLASEGVADCRLGFRP